MRVLLLIAVTIAIACNNNEPQNHSNTIDTLDKIPPAEKIADSIIPEPVTPISKTYSNTRFRQVTVESLGNNKFRVRGEGQIFEANFNWVVEDGHNELQKGFEMTDAGAPAWGKFDFTIDAVKKRENSTLTLILFETSAKDGSRQHELPIALH